LYGILIEFVFDRISFEYLIGIGVQIIAKRLQWNFQHVFIANETI